MANSLAWVFAGGTNLATGLVGYYRLNEAAGANNAIDSSVNGRDLTQINSPGSGPGIISTCRTFVAASAQTFTRPDESALRIFGGDFTITGWFNVSGTSNSQMIVSKIGAASPNFEFQLLFYNVDADVVASLFDTTGASVAAHFLGTMTPITWYFVAARRSGNTLFISRNAGTEKSADVSGLGSIGGNGPLDIGSQHANASPTYFDGSIDEVAVYNRALSTAEIALLYNSGSGRDPTQNP